MEADRLKWDRIFSKKIGSTPPSPPHNLLPFLNELPLSKTLDIASGDGAIALQMAQLGHCVTAMDISRHALQRLSHFAAQCKVNIPTICADLDEPIVLKQHFELITLLRFKPCPKQWQTIISMLAPSGLLFFATFNLAHHHDTGFNRNFCLAPNEFDNLSGLKRLKLAAVQSPDLDIYLFKKQA